MKTPSSSSKGIALKWTKTTGAEGYIIYRKTGTGSYTKLKPEKGVSNLAYRDKSAKKGKKYTYKVKAYDYNLKQEEYIMWLYKKLKEQTYKHGGYTEFYITEPKLRRIEKSKYIDRIVHRWYVNSFMEKYFIPQFIDTSYACIKNKGMHKATLYVQKTMKK